MSSVRGRVRFEKRLDVAKRMTYLVPLMSVGAALVVGAILLLATGHNPIDTYHKVFSRGFGGDADLFARDLYASFFAAEQASFNWRTAAVAPNTSFRDTPACIHAPGILRDSSPWHSPWRPFRHSAPRSNARRAH